MSGSPRLVIDYGTVSTVAVLAWPDGRWTRLRFDDHDVLPSAVYTDPSGKTVTGHQAWRQADDTSGTFMAAPLRTGTLGEPATRDAAQSWTAATLRRVTDEAAHIAGQPVPEVRLVVPAGWGPRRRNWLRGAAAQAGIDQPDLVTGPVALAGLLPVLGVPVPDEAVLLIMDLGSGCEATVLRRDSNGFDVLSALHDAQAGGDAVDDLLLTYLTKSTADPGSTADPPTPPVDATAPASSGGRPWALLASVRTAKETLTHRATATVGLTPPAPATIITTDTVQLLTHPALQRAAAVAEQAITAADIATDDLYGVYCVGAAAATPGLPGVITERLGITPAIMPEAVTITALAAANFKSGAPAKPSHNGGATAGALAGIAAVLVPAVASLTLLTQFLWTTADRDTSASGAVNWGELALATIFAVLACLAATPQLGTLLYQVIQAQTQPQQVQPSPDSRLRYGAVLAAATGIAVTGVFAVLAALFASLPLDSTLRWAVTPAACIAIVAVAVTLGTTRRRPGPSDASTETAGFQRFPVGATILATAGMLLIHYTLTTPRPPDLALYLDLGTRIGGLLIGIGAAFTLVKAPLLRLVLAAPWGLLTATIASPTTTGILATVFTLSVLCWCSYPLLNLLTSTAPPSDNGTLYDSRRRRSLAESDPSRAARQFDDG